MIFVILEILEFENDKSKKISPNTNSLVIHVLKQITFRGTINVFEIQIKSKKIRDLVLKYPTGTLQLSISRSKYFTGYCTLKMTRNRRVNLYYHKEHFGKPIRNTWCVKHKKLTFFMFEKYLWFLRFWAKKLFKVKNTIFELKLIISLSKIRFFDENRQFHSI